MKKNKLLVLFIALMLCLGILPTAAMAADWVEPDFATVTVDGESVANDDSEATMKLSEALAIARANGSKAVVITLTYGAEIDMSGWTAESLSGVQNLVLDGGKETIINMAQPLFISSAGGSSQLTVKDLTFKNSKITSVGSGGETGAGVISNFTQYGGYITVSGVTVTGGTITSGDFAGGLFGYVQLPGTEEKPGMVVENCEITGVTFSSSTGGSIGAVAGHVNNGCVAIRKTKVGNNSMSSPEDGAFREDKNGVVIGRLLGSSAYIDVTETAVSTIETVTGEAINDFVTLEKIVGSIYQSSSKFNISGGEYFAKPTLTTSDDKNSVKLIHLSGATDSNIVVGGVLEKNAQSKWILAAAKIGSVAYGSLAEAVNAANAIIGSVTIEAVANATEMSGDGFTVSNNMTIDLKEGSYEIIGNPAQDACGIIVAANNTLSIKNGTVKSLVGSGVETLISGNVALDAALLDGSSLDSSHKYVIIGAASIAMDNDSEIRGGIHVARNASLAITGIGAIASLTVEPGFTSVSKPADIVLAAPTGYEWKNNTVLSPFSYDITYNNLEAATAGTNAPTSHTYGVVTELVAPAKIGYTFGGWYTTENFAEGTKVESLAADGYTADIILYAKWTENKYSIAFNNNNGKGEMASMTEISYTAEADLSKNTFTKDGYTFNGWNTKADGSGTSYADEAAVSKLSAENDAVFTLFAQWTANTYSIAFDKNGADGTETMTSVDAVYDEAKTLPANTFTNSNKHFAGWSLTGGENNTAAYADGVSVMNLTVDKGATVTLYAVWTNKAAAPAPSTAMTAQEKTYNGAVHGFLNETDIENGYTVTFDQGNGSVEPVNAGIYNVVVFKAETNDTASYNHTITGGLVINPATLTITVEDASIYEGDELPTAYEYTVSGWQGDDSTETTLITEPSFNYDDADNNIADTYEVIAFGADAGSNYIIEYVNATLTVNSGYIGMPVIPSVTPPASSSEPEIPVEGTVAKPAAPTVNGTASAVLSESAVGSMIANAASSGTDTMVISPVVQGDVSSLKVAIPNTAVKTIKEETDAAFAIESGFGNITIPGNAFVSIADQAGIGDVSIEITEGNLLGLKGSLDINKYADSIAVDVKIKSEGNNISHFNGYDIMLSLFKSAQHELGKRYLAFAVSEDGALSRMVAECGEKFMELRTKHLTTFVITTEEIPSFPDVDLDQWYGADIDYVVANGLMLGYDNGEFGINDTTIRGMIVTILYRLENSPAVSGENPFTDVAEGKYYHDAVLWAAANQIVDGYGDGTFKPEDPVSREQMASILWRYAKYKGYDVSVGEDTNILSYTDAFDIHEYAMPAMQWTCGAGIIDGRPGGYLDPRGEAKRCEVAAILHRFCTLSEK